MHERRPPSGWEGDERSSRISFWTLFSDRDWTLKQVAGTVRENIVHPSGPQSMERRMYFKCVPNETRLGWGPVATIAGWNWNNVSRVRGDTTSKGKDLIVIVPRIEIRKDQVIYLYILNQ